MKKKNIIWLCANIAVFALFAFFHSVKFVAAAAVVYSAASPMLCVSIIIAIALTIVAYMICKKKFAGFSVGGVKQALFILLAALSIMGCAMTLNNTFTRGVHNVNTVVIETDDDIRTAFYDGPHRIRVTPWKGAGVDAWIDLPKERCGKVEVGDSIEVKVETGLFGVRICSLTE